MERKRLPVERLKLPTCLRRGDKVQFKNGTGLLGTGTIVEAGEEQSVVKFPSLEICVVNEWLEESYD